MPPPPQRPRTKPQQSTLFGQYQRCHREAALSLAAAVDGGAVPSAEPPRRKRLSLERSSTNPESSSGGGGGDSSTVGGGAGGSGGTLPPLPILPSAGPPAPPLQRRAMSATLVKVREAMPSASNKKDLVQWFLPSEKHRKEALIESAQAAADAAEEARKTCLVRWEALRLSIFSAIQVCLCVCMRVWSCGRVDVYVCWCGCVVRLGFDGLRLVCRRA